MFNFFKKPFLIFLLALFLRLFYVCFFLGINTSPNDHDIWLEKIAFNISNGNGYGLTANEPTARKLPMFPIFLSGIYFIFGHSVAIARIFQILLGALSVLGVYLTVKMIYDEKTALISSLILSIDPLYIYLSGWFLTENLFIVLIVFSFYFLIKYQVLERNKKFLIFSGLLLGLACLTRASLMLFSILIFIWSYSINYPDKNKTFKDGLIVAAIMYFLISGWVIRNYIVFEEIITTETGAGKMFWGGNNPEAIGDTILMTGSPRLYDANERPRGNKGKDWRSWDGSPWLNVFLSTWEGLSEKQVNTKYYNKGWEWIRKNPLDFLKLLPKKIYYFWKFWSPHASFPDIEPILFKIAEVFYYFYLFFAVLGLIYSLNEWRNHILFYLLILDFTISTLLFFGDARQRIPLVPTIAVFAGLGIVKIKNQILKSNTQG